MHTKKPAHATHAHTHTLTNKYIYAGASTGAGGGRMVSSRPGFNAKLFGDAEGGYHAAQVGRLCLNDVLCILQQCILEQILEHVLNTFLVPVIRFKTCCMSLKQSLTGRQAAFLVTVEHSNYTLCSVI